MVQMNNVTMVYDNSDVAALDNFSLTINEGEFAFLVGPSGSGKTTIIKLLTGEIMASDEYSLVRLKKENISLWPWIYHAVPFLKPQHK